VLCAFPAENPFILYENPQQIRLLKIVPPILVFMAKSPMLEKFHLSHLHGIVTGAAPLGSDVCEELRRRLPNLQFILQG
jgi:4-coumarate--CoA ligase